MSIPEDKLPVNYWQAMQSSVRLRMIADFPFPENSQSCLLMTYPQTPEIIAGGNGCAFRWNAENEKQTTLLTRFFCAALRLWRGRNL